MKQEVVILISSMGMTDVLDFGLNDKCASEAILAKKHINLPRQTLPNFKHTKRNKPKIRRN